VAVHIPNLLAVGFLTELFQYFMRRRRAQVSPEERSLKVVQSIPVNLLADRNYCFDALSQIFPRAGYRFLHAIEETGFLLFVEAAKKSLNHGISGPGSTEPIIAGRALTAWRARGESARRAISNWHGTQPNADR
jgi:hypothetical protein